MAASVAVIKTSLSTWDNSELFYPFSFPFIFLIRYLWHETDLLVANKGALRYLLSCFIHWTRDACEFILHTIWNIISEEN